MWVIFDEINFRDNLISNKTGNVYSGWEAKGTKKGYGTTPDEPWSKVFFDNQTTTIIEEGGVPNNNQSIVQYLMKGAKKGDTLIIKMERDGTFWRIVSIENFTQNGRAGGKAPDYTPLSEQNKVNHITGAQQQAPSAPHSPADLPW